MSVNEWKDLFVTIGSFMVGLILAIGQVYTIYKMKKQELHQYAKDNLPKSYGENIKAENRYAIEMQKEIEELRQMLSADRVQVLEFHNGTDFSTRKGYRIDCTYETLKYGNESVKGILQNYPTTMLPIFMNKVIEEKQYLVPDVQKLSNTDMSTYAMKLNMHVGAFYDFILEHNNMPIGILAVQFSQPISLDDDQIAMIHAKKIIIEELLK